jgi:Recombination endonuclease VII
MVLKRCNTCRRELPDESFYVVSRGSGRRRGQCKDCMRARKALQRSADWRPSCSRCGAQLADRVGSGRRLCGECFSATYDVADRRGNGARRIRLRPCSLCGGTKERFERGKVCVSCRPWLGYAASLRRFGLAPAEYKALLDAQGGQCFICGQVAGAERLRIDHDHELPAGREAVRGLLCNTCNYQRLPLFDETPAMLLRAVEYLREPPARAVLQRRVGSCSPGLARWRAMQAPG